MNKTESSSKAEPPLERRLVGIAVSAGVAIGPMFRAVEPAAVVTRHKIQAADSDAEIARLDAAIAQSRKQLLKLRARLGVLPEESQAEIAPLLDAYLQMIGSSRLVRGARKRIADMLLSAETAVVDETAAIAAAILAMPSDDAASRRRHSEEVHEIGRRLVRNLTRVAFRSFAGLPEGAVLVSESLRPADAALLDPSRLAGVATDEGGADGYTAIMLRALGVPAVLGAAGLSQVMHPGDILVVDGSAGTVVVNPSAATLAAARRAVSAFARERQKLGRLRRLASVTLDGESVELQANLEIPAELPLIAQSGAAGIGLLRSEFLFMNRDAIPGEEEQFKELASIVRRMQGRPVTIRTLDVGADKLGDAFGLKPGPNPALGLRAIRFSLAHRKLLLTQLSAILRAGALGPVRILLPMVCTVDEVRQVRKILDRLTSRMKRRGVKIGAPPPLGVMIEIPGAALAADALAAEADFFAIGTNDLTQYTLASDRTDEQVAYLYTPLHPAVLRLIQFAAEAANAAGIPVSVCGEMAGDERMTPVLLGFGITELSMAPASLPRVKKRILGLNLAEIVGKVRRITTLADPAKVLKAVDELSS